MDADSGVRPFPGAATLAWASGWKILWQAGNLLLAAIDMALLAELVYRPEASERRRVCRAETATATDHGQRTIRLSILLWFFGRACDMLALIPVNENMHGPNQDGLNLYFTREYLRAGVLVSLLSVWVLVALFYYLNRHTKRRYFTIWTVAWLFYALWITLTFGTQGENS